MDQNLKHTEEKTPKMANITFTILNFASKSSNFIATLNALESTSFDEIVR